MRVGSVAVIMNYQSLPVRVRLAVHIYWPLLTARVTIPYIRSSIVVFTPGGKLIASCSRRAALKFVPGPHIRVLLVFPAKQFGIREGALAKSIQTDRQIESVSLVLF
jgi:hypothetical protein